MHRARRKPVAAGPMAVKTFTFTTDPVVKWRLVDQRAVASQRIVGRSQVRHLRYPSPRSINALEITEVAGRQILVGLSNQNCGLNHALREWRL